MLGDSLPRRPSGCWAVRGGQAYGEFLSPQGFQLRHPSYFLGPKHQGTKEQDFRVCCAVQAGDPHDTHGQCPVQQCIVPKRVLAFTFIYFFDIFCAASGPSLLICVLQDWELP